jgi:hypothetical protein
VIEMERAVCDSSRAPGSQKSVDQFRQLAAIAAFENRCGGNADLTQPIAEPAVASEAYKIIRRG